MWSKDTGTLKLKKICLEEIKNLNFEWIFFFQSHGDTTLITYTGIWSVRCLISVGRIKRERVSLVELNLTFSMWPIIFIRQYDIS